MRRATRLATMAVVAVVASTAMGRGAWSASATPDFSGEWRIDPSRGSGE